MRTIVLGAGKVGFELAKRLTSEEHDVVVIDRDASALKEIDENLDVLAVHGNGASMKVLDQSSIKSAELSVAVTDSDEVNMISCMLAKQLGVTTTVARIRSSD